MNKKTVMVTLLIITLLSSLLVVNVGAPPKPEKPAKPSFWFFSEDPSPDFWNPEDEDPNYVGDGDPCNSDEWFKESILYNIDWEEHQGEEVEFSFWLGVHPENSKSEDTSVVVVINKAAYDGIDKIQVNSEEIDPGDWITDPEDLLPPKGPLSNHGIYKSDEFYGYIIVDVGDIDGSKIGEDEDPDIVEIKFKILLEEDASNDMKIHLDAFNEEGAAGPYSHDANAGYCEGEKGKITVKKKIDWGYQSQYQNGWTFQFEADWTEPFELENGESMTWELPPGKYTVLETWPEGWELYDIIVEGGEFKVKDNSVTVELEAGDKIVVTFINRPPDWVIPENPLGTFGAIISMVLALALALSYQKGLLNIKIE